MGKIIFDLSPDTKAHLQANQPLLLQAIESANNTCAPAIREAVIDIQSKLEGSGHNYLAKAASPKNSVDGNVYIWINVIDETSSQAVVSEKGHAMIIFQPNDLEKQYVGTDGANHPTTLPEIIGHELAHIARGHHQGKSGFLERIFGANVTEAPVIRDINESLRIPFGKTARIENDYHNSTVTISNNAPPALNCKP